MIPAFRSIACLRTTEITGQGSVVLRLFQRSPWASSNKYRTLMDEVNLDSLPAQPHTAVGQSLPEKNAPKVSLQFLTEKLPLELVEEIFLFCLPPRTYIAPSPVDAPLLLCRICSSWRALAISTPRLWCSINAFKPKPIMETWLSRAGDCPLAISFAIPPFIPKILPLPPHIAHLVQYSSRWKNITLRMQSGASFRVLEIAALPLLHTLRLDGYGIHIDGQEEFLGLLRSASNLRKISWYISTINPCSVNIPWSALTDFHSHYDLTIREVVRILSDAPLLHRLVVAISDSSNISTCPSTRRLPSLVHNHVRELELTARRHLTALFDSLALPALKILYIDDEVRSSIYWPHQEFLSFLGHFCSTLTSLHLDSPAITQENVIEYLRRTQSLVHFHMEDGIIGSSVMDQLISVLTYRGSEGIPCLCPRLESISLACKFDDEVMVAMIESRWRMTLPGHAVRRGSMSPDQCRTDHNETGTASTEGWVPSHSSAFHQPPCQLKSVEIEIHSNVQANIDRLIALQDEGLQMEFL